MQIPKDRAQPDAVEAVSLQSWTAIRAALTELLGADASQEYGLSERGEAGPARVERNRTLFHASALLTRRARRTQPELDG